MANVKFDTNSRVTLSNGDAGSNNTVFGYQAGNLIDSGDNNNVFIGHLVADANMTNAIENVGIGVSALSALTSGDKNICIGYSAGEVLTDSSSCILIGDRCGDLINNTSADGTVGIGSGALTALTTGAGNIAVGYQSLQAITQGDDNVAVGKQALYSMAATDGNDNNIAIGTSALYTAGASSNVAMHNIAIGTNALKLNQTGDFNIGIGANAGTALTAAGKTIAIGEGALKGVATQDGTIAIGYEALNDLTSGAGNTVIGYQSSDAMTTATLNTAVGYQSLSASVDGDRNTALGYQSMLIYNNTGSSHVGENTCIGYQAGAELTTGVQNIIIGSETNASAVGGVNQTVIGYGANGQADNSVVLGNAAVTDVYMAQDKGATVHCAGIDFSVNTSDAGGRANELLDEYEEGTWTPAFGFASGGSMSYSEQVGHYTKIGNTVNCWFDLTCSAANSPNGVASLGGLPFTIKNVNARAGLSSGYTTAFEGDDKSPTGGYAEGNNSIVNLLTQDGEDARTNQSTNVTHTSFGGNERMIGSITYVATV